MIRWLNLNNAADISEILRVQQLSYTVEAELIGFDGIPPLADDENSLKNCGETFQGYFNDSQLVAVIAYKRDAGQLDIHRLVVSPDYFQKGYATAMLGFIEMEEEGIDEIIVSTAAKNFPALKLYEKLGFERVSRRMMGGKLEIINLRKKIIR